MKHYTRYLTLILLVGVLSVSVQAISISPGNAVIDFKGDEYVEIPDNSDDSLRNGEMTIAFWLKVDAAQQADLGSGYINPIGKGVPGEQEWNFKLYSNKISFGVYDRNGSGVSSFFTDELAADTWIFVTAKVKNGRIDLYKNGIAQDSDSFSGVITPRNGVAPLRIATRVKDSFFEGNIADVVIFNKALSGSEIRELYRLGLRADVSRNSGNYVSSANVVGWYKLNDATSVVTDYSSKENDGLFYSGELLSVPLITNLTSTLESSSADLEFDGDDDYGLIADHNDFSLPTTGQITISAWIKPSTLRFENTMGTGFVHFLSKGDGGSQEWALRMYSNDNSEGRRNRISFYLFNPNGGLGAGSYVQEDVEVGEWIHIIAVAGNNQIKIYKNGVLKDTDTYEGSPYYITPRNTNSPVRLGAGGGSYFAGEMTQVTVLNRKLSSQEVSELYEGGRNFDMSRNSGDYASSNNVVAWYKEVGEDGTIRDFSSQGHNGEMRS